MTHWQNFYHEASAEELDRYTATAHIAANPYALIACMAVHVASKHDEDTFDRMTRGRWPEK